MEIVEPQVFLFASLCTFLGVVEMYLHKFPANKEWIPRITPWQTCMVIGTFLICFFSLDSVLINSFALSTLWAWTMVLLKYSLLMLAVAFCGNMIPV